MFKSGALGPDVKYMQYFMDTSSDGITSDGYNALGTDLRAVDS